jgi:hypothetical protein
MPSISALSEAHLPTLEEIIHNDPFEIIHSPWGHIEAWRASTLATGTMGALAQVYDIVRNDAADRAARADADAARSTLIQHVCDKIAEFEKRFDALTARLATAEDKRRADEQAAREFEEPIEEPPGTSDDTPASSGELHALPPSEKPEPSLEVGGDEVEFELPEPQDPTGTVVPQPTAIQLNEG